jgi:UDP-N-acetylglucosamine 3-dehydrogenase
MNKKDTIGLIGFGYWGKIILKNLLELGYRDITICELDTIDWEELGTKYKYEQSYKNINCDKVFIITPTTTHYEVVKYFLEKGVDVFCEKPLTLTSTKCDKLYKLQEKNNCTLHVDWIFTHHPAVEKIKEIIKQIGIPKNIIANRMNFGPVRYDVNARWDLASHDVSIMNYLLDNTPDEIDWIDFKRNREHIEDDSVVGILKYNGTAVQINASWEFGRKDRAFIIEFKDGSFLEWDDTNSIIKHNFKTIEYENSSPLHNSINTFLNNKTNRNITMEITRILEQ